MTTSGQADPLCLERARAAAHRWGLPYLERKRKEPLRPVIGQLARALLVFGHQGIELWDSQGSMRYSPGMGRLRVKRLDAGADEDVLVRLAQLGPGDHLIDCTLGLGADSLAAARAVGPRGRVLGVEKSLPLYALASEGLAAYDFGPRSCRVEVALGDCAELLRALPDRSFDVVLFDPMFERPRRSSPAFEMLRRFADGSPLSPQTLERARIVARRWVLVKGARHSGELGRLGLSPQPRSPHAAVAWARVPAS